MRWSAGLLFIFALNICTCAAWSESPSKRRHAPKYMPEMVCPALRRGEKGTDGIEKCSSNEDCAINQLCCFNGDGTECKTACPKEGTQAPCKGISFFNEDLDVCCTNCTYGYRLEGCKCKPDCKYGCDECHNYKEDQCCTKCSEGFVQVGCKCQRPIPQGQCGLGCGGCYKDEMGESCCTECEMGYELVTSGCHCQHKAVCTDIDGCAECRNWKGNACCINCDEGYILSGCSCVPKPTCQTGCESCFMYDGINCCETCADGFSQVGCSCVQPPVCEEGCAGLGDGAACYWSTPNQLEVERQNIRPDGQCCYQCQDGYDFDGCKCHKRPDCPEGCDDCRHMFGLPQSACCVKCTPPLVRDGRCGCKAPPQCHRDYDCANTLDDCCVNECIRGQCVEKKINCDDNNPCTEDVCWRGSCMHHDHHSWECDALRPPVCYTVDTETVERSPTESITGTTPSHTQAAIPCVIPFRYEVAPHDVRTFTGCILNGADKPWCATAVDEAGLVLEKGYCSEDCPFQCTTDEEPSMESSGYPCATTWTTDLSTRLTDIVFNGCVATGTFNAAWCPLAPATSWSEGDPRGRCNPMCQEPDRQNCKSIGMKIASELPGYVPVRGYAWDGVTDEVVVHPNGQRAFAVNIGSVFMLNIEDPEDIKLIAVCSLRDQGPNTYGTVPVTNILTGESRNPRYNEVISGVATSGNNLVISISGLLGGRFMYYTWSDDGFVFSHKETANIPNQCYYSEFTADGTQLWWACLGTPEFDEEGAPPATGGYVVVVSTPASLAAWGTMKVFNWLDVSTAVTPSVQDQAPTAFADAYNTLSQDQMQWWFSSITAGPQGTDTMLVTVRNLNLVVVFAVGVAPAVLGDRTVLLPLQDNGVHALDASQNYAINIQTWPGFVSAAKPQDVCFLDQPCSGANCPNPFDRGMMYTMNGGFHSTERGTKMFSLATWDESVAEDMEKYMPGEAAGFLRLSPLSDADGDGDFDRVVISGARGFYGLRLGQKTLQYTSSDSFERLNAAINPFRFNNEDRGWQTRGAGADDASGGLGPLPYKCTIGVVGGRNIMFTATYHTGVIVAWDLSDPANPDYAGQFSLPNYIRSTESISFVTRGDGGFLVFTAGLTGQVVAIEVTDGCPHSY